MLGPYSFLKIFNPLEEGLPFVAGEYAERITPLSQEDKGDEGWPDVFEVNGTPLEKVMPRRILVDPHDDGDAQTSSFPSFYRSPLYKWQKEVRDVLAIWQEVAAANRENKPVSWLRINQDGSLKWKRQNGTPISVEDAFARLYELLQQVHDAPIWFVRGLHVLGDDLAIKPVEDLYQILRAFANLPHEISPYYFGKVIGESNPGHDDYAQAQLTMMVVALTARRMICALAALLGQGEELYQKKFWGEISFLQKYIEPDFQTEAFLCDLYRDRDVYFASGINKSHPLGALMKLFVFHQHAMLYTSCEIGGQDKIDLLMKGDANEIPSDSGSFMDTFRESYLTMLAVGRRSMNRLDGKEKDFLAKGDMAIVAKGRDHLARIMRIIGGEPFCPAIMNVHGEDRMQRLLLQNRYDFYDSWWRLIGNLPALREAVNRREHENHEREGRDLFGAPRGEVGEEDIARYFSPSLQRGSLFFFWQQLAYRGDLSDIISDSVRSLRRSFDKDTEPSLYFLWEEYADDLDRFLEGDFHPDLLQRIKVLLATTRHGEARLGCPVGKWRVISGAIKNLDFVFSILTGELSEKNEHQENGMMPNNGRHDIDLPSRAFLIYASDAIRYGEKNGASLQSVLKDIHCWQILNAADNKDFSEEIRLTRESILGEDSVDHSPGTMIFIPNLPRVQLMLQELYEAAKQAGIGERHLRQLEEAQRLVSVAATPYPLAQSLRYFFARKPSSSVLSQSESRKRA